MVLLDHMDWLGDAQVQQEWAVLCRKLRPGTGRILWRSFGHQLRCTPPSSSLWLDRKAVVRAEAETPDRVGMYNGTFLARSALSSVQLNAERHAVMGDKKTKGESCEGKVAEPSDLVHACIL